MRFSGVIGIGEPRRQSPYTLITCRVALQCYAQDVLIRQMDSLTSASAKQTKDDSAKRAAPIVETVPLPTYDGGCLGQIPIFPLQRDTSYLANKTFHKSWDVTVQGEKQSFYCKGRYGSIPPNGYTQDIVVSACSFAVEHGGPAFVPASFYRFAKVKGVTPCRSHRDSVIRAFRSTNMTVATNAIYDPAEKKWETVEVQSIISSFAYIDEDGQYRERYLTKTAESGELVTVKSEERVKQLKRFSIDPEYYQHFVGGGKVHYDLNAYFHMENPTSKRAYLNLCSALQLFGGQEMSFKTYLKLLGKDAEYVDTRTEAELRSWVTPDLERVNQLGIGQILLVEAPSGLKTVLTTSKKILRLAPDLRSFAPLERRTYQELCAAGLYANIAKTFVVRFSQALRRELLSYAQFAIRQETTKAKARIKSGAAKVTDLRKHVGSNLTKAFCLDPESVGARKSLGDHWHYGAWRDWQSSQKNANYRANAEISKAARLIGSQVNTTVDETSCTGDAASSFDLTQFRSEYEDVYLRVITAVHRRYPFTFSSSLDNEAKMEHLACVEKQREEAIETYCRQCHNEFRKGHHDFFPSVLLGVD